MAGTTPNHFLETPSTGEYEDEWGKILNSNFEEVDLKMIIRGPLADRPPAGTEGRLFLATDEGNVYYDTGSSWGIVAGRDLDGRDFTDGAEVIWDASEGHIPSSAVEDTLGVDTTDYVPLSSEPAHNAGRVALSDGTGWDPDGDGSAELVISDGNSWNEITDLGETL